MYMLNIWQTEWHNDYFELFQHKEKWRNKVRLTKCGELGNISKEISTVSVEGAICLFLFFLVAYSKIWEDNN